MKICLIAPLFDPWNVGGAEKYINTLAHELSKHHEIVVITTTGPTQRKQEHSTNNLKIFEIKPKNVDSLYFMIQNDACVGSVKKFIWHFFNVWNISSFMQIMKILKEEKPEIVHTNGIKGFSPSIFSAIKDSGIPHVHTIHDYELISPTVTLFRNGRVITKFNFLERIYTSHIRKIAVNINAVISPSQFTMDFHTKLGFFKNSKKYVIPNGIILDENATVKKNSGKEFLFIGQVIENKGPHIAVKAFKKIKDKDARLHIVGKGSFLDALKQIADGDERIIFHGFVSNDELEKIFKRCTFAILPSLWYENFPLVINEVMSKGFPVIASNIGGIPELVKHGYNGFLFEAGNIDALYSIIENILNGVVSLPELSQNAIGSSKRFPMEEQLKSILKVYSEIGSH